MKLYKGRLRHLVTRDKSAPQDHARHLGHCRGCGACKVLINKQFQGLRCGHSDIYGGVCIEGSSSSTRLFPKFSVEHTAKHKVLYPLRGRYSGYSVIGQRF